jgi:MFS family permease
VPPYFLRVRGDSEAEAGLMLGGTAAAAGWLGVTLGGLWSDRWRRTAEGARFYVGMVAAILPLPFLVWMLRSESNATAYALNVFVGIATSMWIGPGAAMVQDLVPARLRGTASAAYLVVITFIGLALGPYTIGRLSVALGNDLREAMLWGLLVNPVAAFLLWRASVHHRGTPRITEEF